ncbi:unnamed protein product [Amoebophrya sp. A120]|nr:unnamed protein product [Amoebophrya sp. A120]|eukprot:GSA120T00003361001.1
MHGQYYAPVGGGYYAQTGAAPASGYGAAGTFLGTQKPPKSGKKKMVHPPPGFSAPPGLEGMSEEDYNTTAGYYAAVASYMPSHMSSGYYAPGASATATAGGAAHEHHARNDEYEDAMALVTQEFNSEADPAAAGWFAAGAEHYGTAAPGLQAATAGGAAAAPLATATTASTATSGSTAATTAEQGVKSVTAGKKGPSGRKGGGPTPQRESVDPVAAASKGASPETTGDNGATTWASIAASSSKKSKKAKSNTAMAQKYLQVNTGTAGKAVQLNLPEKMSLEVQEASPGSHGNGDAEDIKPNEDGSDVGQRTSPEAGVESYPAAGAAAAGAASDPQPKSEKESGARRDEVMDQRAEFLREQEERREHPDDLHKQQKEREKALRQKQREAAERFRKEAAEKRRAADEERAEIRRKKREEQERKKPTLIEAMQQGPAPHADPNAKKPGVLFQQPAAPPGAHVNQSSAAPGFKGYQSPNRAQMWYGQWASPENAYLYDAAAAAAAQLDHAAVVVDASDAEHVVESLTGDGTGAVDDDGVEVSCILRAEVPLAVLYKGGPFEHKDEFESVTFTIPPLTKPGTKLTENSQTLVVCLADEEKEMLDGEDLKLENVPIDFYTALLGGTCKANVFGEEVELAVPRMVRDGDIRVYPGLGWGKEGRLTITFQVSEPENWSEVQKKFCAAIDHDPEPKSTAVMPEK